MAGEANARGPLYLASQSPRRCELLTQVGIPFQVLSVDVPEDALVGERPAALVERLSRDKALAGVARLSTRGMLDRDCVIGADTLVVRDGRALGKPADHAQADAMLAQLSGRSHQVMTAMALAWNGQVESRLSVSEVTFRTITAAERLAYIATGEPMDKAGAYGIQGVGGLFVTQLKGSYSGVMGLALHHVDELLRLAGSPALFSTAGP